MKKIKYNLSAIVKAAHGFARIYHNQPRDWDPVMFKPREQPLPPEPYSKYLRAGFKQAWSNARLEIKHRLSGDTRGPWSTSGYRLTTVEE